MGMSTHVVGYHPPDDEWEKMKKIWDACAEAGIKPPDKVNKFFDWTPPSDRGVDVNLEKHKCLSRPDSEHMDIWEIDISKLPENITHIRFINSY